MFFHKVSLQILALCSFHLASSSPTHNVKLLPKPSGPFDVAINTMELIDHGRLDPFAPTNTSRRMMVSAVYPVENSHSNCRYPYMPPFTAKTEDEIFSFLPAGSYESLFLQVGCSSKPLADAPLVLFSPAQGNNRLDYGLIASNVASYGFTVITMDHPYIADLVEFSDGSYILAAPITAINLQEIIAEGTAAIVVQAQDTSFVLDQLANKTLLHQLIPGRTCELDASSVAMFGHSFGGATAAVAMVNDTRIKGGVDMDGAVFNASDTLDVGFDRPFLFFSHQNDTRFYNGTDLGDDFSAETWSALWSALTGWKLELELDHSLHYSFSDFPSQLETLGVRLPAVELVTLLSGNDTDIPAEAVQGIADSLLEAQRGMHAVVSYVVAFMEFVLKGKVEGLLCGPSERFPEVTFI
ncbi:putative 1-alkyl-2-acetylglycerophosphocholine esterase [Hyphodiscus hymeniophilus]|uniref:1-alkyl-2-acetylglycerophosphocholine esterase n=1 Tax=Hyphodiscus hymeniophilus TaxID=353542 RepID=A0A9P7AZM7_9HELO|nr:putative 1-alkyl-2-acetylglycerophosphocholine esterase [Hyphodiscus hymeniophilus]